MSNTLTTHAVAAVPAVDAWEKIGSFATSAQNAATLVGGLLAVLFVIFAGWKTKGAIGGIISGGLTAILFVWFVSNVDAASNQQTITETVNDTGMPSISQEYRPADGS